MKREFLRFLAVFVLLGATLFVGGCDQKMPWQEEEKPPEKTEKELLQEEYNELKAEYNEKAKAREDLQKLVKGDKRGNKAGGISVNIICGKCGQNKSIKSGANPGKCFYCSNRTVWKAEAFRDDRDQDARLANLNKIKTLRKEIRKLHEKMTIIKEKAKQIVKEEKKSGKYKRRKKKEEN